MRLLWIPLAIALAAAPLRAQQNAQIPDPDPELERKSLQVADGFEINLFAADPLLAKPIQMNFDAAGRLWVASSEVYPQIKPGQKANDKILVIEDTKGVGRADKVTVFADGLLIPTGVEPGDGGAYVANSTELLHLSRSSGSGKADCQRVVLSGFGTEDTHHILHTLRWGPDGMLYFNQSVYIHSHIETPYGVRRLNGGGIWQFRPETMRLEVFLRGWWNAWGHHFDRFGESFVTDGAGGNGINVGVPGATYDDAPPSAPRVLKGLNPGSPKYCGLEVVSGRHLPESWQGNLITNDFRGHRVCRFVVSEDGSGYAAREQPELVRSNHPAFRPVDVKMGPDGAIYIADWYNPIIQHGEVDFRDPRRDHTHGRIWRITAKGRPLAPRPELAKATVEQLLAGFGEPEQWTRHFARRTLTERGADAVRPALAAWVKSVDTGKPGAEPLLLEALWTYQSLDVVEPALLGRLLRATDHRVRAAAVRVAAAWHDRHPETFAELRAAVADEHPRVRLEAVRGLARVNRPEAVEAALQALERPVDRTLDYAMWLTARDLAPVWQPAFERGALTFHGNARHLIFALQAAGSPASVKPLVGLVKSGKLAADRAEPVLALIASLGGPDDLSLVLDHVLSHNDFAGQTVLLDALEAAARQRRVVPSGDTARIGPLLTAEADAVRAVAARLAGLWKVEPLRPTLADVARSPRTSPAARQAALEALVALGGPQTRAVIDALLGPKQPASTRRQAVMALTALDLPAAAAAAVALLTTGSAADDPSELVTAFLHRKGGPEALAAALDGKTVPLDAAKLALRTVRAAGFAAPPLIDALTKAGHVGPGLRKLTGEQLKQFAAEVAEKGDAARGEAVYRRADQSCLKCHGIAGAGGQVGPDLASIGASAPVDYLIESILEPNKAVKENYHLTVVTTAKGQLLTGIKVRETKDELVLRNNEDKEISISVKDIEERGLGGSLMPEGLADTLTRRELVDLIRFLSELGKVGPYSVSKARLARRWRVLEANRQATELLRRTPDAVAGWSPALVWTPGYTRVSGVLPVDELPKIAGSRGPVSVARCWVDVTTAGPAKLRFNSADGLSLWLDGVPLEPKTEVDVVFPAGVHALTVVIDRGRRHDGVSCELVDQPDAPTRVMFVAGK